MTTRLNSFHQKNQREYKKHTILHYLIESKMTILTKTKQRLHLRNHDGDDDNNNNNNNNEINKK